MTMYEMKEHVAKHADPKRDISGLEAIVLNLDTHRKHVMKIGCQLVKLVLDTEQDQPFVSPSGTPEDEIVSICV